MLEQLLTVEEIFELVSERLPDELAGFDPTSQKGVLGMFDSLAWYCTEYEVPEEFMGTIERLWDVAESHERRAVRIHVTTRLLKSLIAAGADPGPFIERMDLSARHVAACDGSLPLEHCRRLLRDELDADDEIAGELAVQKIREVIAERERGE